MSKIITIVVGVDGMIRLYDSQTTFNSNTLKYSFPQSDSLLIHLLEENINDFKIIKESDISKYTPSHKYYEVLVINSEGNYCSHQKYSVKNCNESEKIVRENMVGFEDTNAVTEITKEEFYSGGGLYRTVL